MNCQDILNAAIRKVCEDPSDSATDDYRERAPYLLADFLSECSRLDAFYRQAHGLPATLPFEEVYISLSAEFPLCKVFAPAAANWLAAMLVVEENEELSDRLFARSSDLLAKIQTSVPAGRKTITDVYRLSEC